MSKAARILVISLTLTVILIVSITGIAAASGPGPNYEDCPNYGDCPNDGSGTQTQDQLCTSTQTQQQLNNQSGDEGNCICNKYCKNNQYKYGVEPE